MKPYSFRRTNLFWKSALAQDDWRCGFVINADTSPALISPKTVQRAKANLQRFANTDLIYGDFLTYPFSDRFLPQGTLKNYISNIYNKIGTKDRTTVAMLLKDVLEIE